jgi:outer membrane protein assembly factor BamC
MNKRILILLVLAPTLLNGCRYLTGDDGYFRDRQSDYLESPVIPQMRIPEELDSYTLDQLYVVPERDVVTRQDYSQDIPRPKPIDDNRPEGVVIRRYEGENWVVVAAAPGQVWPRVRDYWTQLGYELEYENPVEGVMETGWVEGTESLTIRDKYRLRIEPGLHSGSSDIFIVQISRPWNSVGNQLVVWPERSESEDKEFEILEQVSQYLADRTDIYSSSSSSLLAGSLAGERKASLIENGINDSELQLRISLTRAWGQVAQALERADIAIVDRDRDASVFEVQFSGNRALLDEPGFFSRMFGRGNDDEVVEIPFRITLEETASGIRVLAESQADSATNGRLKNEILQLILINIG